MSINKINGVVSDTLSKVNGTNDALLSNMLVPSNLAIAPMFNSHSIDLDGAADYLDLATVVGDIDTDAGAVTLWFKLDTDDTSILWKCGSNTSASNNLMQIYYNAGNNKITFQQIYGGVTKTYTTAAITAGDDSWNFIAMSWSDTDYYAHLNAAASGQQAPVSPGTVTTINHCMVGKNSDVGGTDYFFPGHINEVAMWDAQLDEDAIAAIYNGGKGINLSRDVGNYDNADDLIGYWKMEENTGDTIVDSSGGGETGALNAVDLWSTDTI